jgi:conjugative transposon TraJ protein
MRRQIIYVAGLAATGVLLPDLVYCQSVAGEIADFRSVLDTLYLEMIPLCGQLIGVGRGLAAFGAMWYIASRVWRHIARAEQVDFYPLLRPFVLGMVILMYPSFLALMNGVLRPTVTGTAAMVEGSNRSISVLLKQKEEAIKKTAYWQMYVGDRGRGDQDRWLKYMYPDGAPGGMLSGLSNDINFAMAKAYNNFRNAIKQWMSEILHVLFEAAALCINTIRTFYLIVLAILGPIVLGFSVYDGFQNTLQVWAGRYINVFLWLPVANIFGAIIGKIQENMLKVDIRQVNLYGDTFFNSTDSAYLIFMVIGIIGYFTVPSVAGYIVYATGANALLYKATNFGNTTVSKAAGMVSSPVTPTHYNENPRMPHTAMDRNPHLHDKLSGKK